MYVDSSDNRLRMRCPYVTCLSDRTLHFMKLENISFVMNFEEIILGGDMVNWYISLFVSDIAVC